MDAASREARMLEQAQQSVMANDDWLIYSGVVALMHETTVRLSSDPYAMVRDGTLFVVRYGEIDYFPAYAFDQTSGQLCQSLQYVIEVFVTQKSAWGMAFWFGSPNSYLGGRKPKNVLMEDPVAVLDAARDEVRGILHG